MGEWKQCKLKDICKTNASSYSSKDNYSFVNYLDTGNITQNVIDEVQFIDIEKDKLPSRAKRKVQRQGLLRHKQKRQTKLLPQVNKVLVFLFRLFI